MTAEKEKLIKLIKEFAAVDISNDSDEDTSNDKLAEIADEMVEASVAVFGYEIDMDFGVINAIYHNTEEVIKGIEEYEIGKS